jgi:translation initiation factor eIF-2B subunit delta
LLQAHEKGIEFRVVVVDSRPKLEGKDTAQILSRHGIKCSYVYTNSLFLVMKEATKVIVGASSILSNGDLMSRVGTSIVAMSAYDNKVPVMVLCEIYKFSDTVRLDSFVWNEIGNPDALVDVSNIPPSKRLLPSLRTDEKNTNGVLENWRQIDTLKLLNLTYDITPAKFITMVCCEFGQIPSTLVLSVLRSQNLFQA